MRDPTRGGPSTLRRVADDGRTDARGLRRIDPTGALSELPGVSAAGVVLILGRVWAQAVGEGVAAHTWPARIARDGTVVVHCSSSTWVSELELMAGTVARRLQEALGEPEPRALRFRLGPMPHRTASPAPAPRPPAPDAATRAQAALLAAAVADDELRAALERAIASRLARPPESTSTPPAEGSDVPGREGPSGILNPGSEAWRHRR